MNNQKYIEILVWGYVYGLKWVQKINPEYIEYGKNRNQEEKWQATKYRILIQNTYLKYINKKDFDYIVNYYLPFINDESLIKFSIQETINMNKKFVFKIEEVEKEFIKFCEKNKNMSKKDILNTVFHLYEKCNLDKKTKENDEK